MCCLPSLYVTRQRDTIQPIIHVTNTEYENNNSIILYIILTFVFVGVLLSYYCRQCIKKIPIIGWFLTTFINHCNNTTNAKDA